MRYSCFSDRGLWHRTRLSLGSSQGTVSHHPVPKTDLQDFGDVCQIVPECIIALLPALLRDMMSDLQLAHVLVTPQLSQNRSVATGQYMIRSQS